jgi:hypothetical protein
MFVFYPYADGNSKKGIFSIVPDSEPLDVIP